LRLIDSCITQVKAQGPSRTCNESKEEIRCGGPVSSGEGTPLLVFTAHRLLYHSTLGLRVIKIERERGTT